MLLDSAGHVVLSSYLPALQLANHPPESLHEYTPDLPFFAPELLTDDMNWQRLVAGPSNAYSFGALVHFLLLGKVRQYLGVLFSRIPPPHCFSSRLPPRGITAQRLRCRGI